MRSLATLGGVLVLIVLAIAWRISNNVEAGQDPDPRSGIVTLGIEADAGEADGNGNISEGGLSGPEKGQASKPEQGAADGGTAGTATDPGSGTSTDGKIDDGGESGLAGPEGDESDPSLGGEGAGNHESKGDGNQAEGGEGSSADEGGAQTPDSGIVYTVKEGDTLYRILMNAYGTAAPDLIEEIAAANHMDDPGAIRAGDKLKLPKLEGYPEPKDP